MITTSMNRLGAVIIALVCGVMFAGCDPAREEVELTWQELNATAERRDGPAFAALLAPESFPPIERLIKFALDGTWNQISGLSLDDRYEIIVMRATMKRKDLAAMNGKAWVTHSVNQGWQGGNSETELKVGKIRTRGNSATVEIIYEWGRGLRTRNTVVNTLAFIKVEDRWLADWRPESPLLRLIVDYMREVDHLSEDQALLHIATAMTGKEIDKTVLDQPMKR